MTLYKNKYRNESARLPGYDYSTPGYYFVTVCTHDRGHLFGKIDNGKMHLNEYGQIVRDEWEKTGSANPHIKLHSFQIMPNHFHGIIQIVYRVCRDVARNVPTITTRNAPTGNNGNVPITKNDDRTSDTAKNEKMATISPNAGSLSQIMRSFKSAITKQINQTRNTPGARVLQPRFHDHVIRNDNELYRIRHYIENNPANWQTDRMGPGSKDARPCVPQGVSEETAPYREEPWMI